MNLRQVWVVLASLVFAVPLCSQSATRNFDLPASPNLENIRMPARNKARLTSALRAILKNSEYPFETESEFNETLRSIRLKRIDLNGDGVDEIIAQGSEPGVFCGHSGICSAWILQEERDRYAVIFNGSAQMFRIIKTSRNKYADVETSYQYSADKIEFNLYRFEKSRYVKSKCWRNVFSNGVGSPPRVENCD